jgi:hypothetical protein
VVKDDFNKEKQCHDCSGAGEGRSVDVGIITAVDYTLLHLGKNDSSNNIDLSQIRSS